MTVFGPDVSKWQTGLVPPEPPGIAFGICRATNGFSPDPTAVKVIEWCKTRKIPFCAYHFVYPCATHPPEVQAEAFHKAVGENVCCMIDWESDTDDNCHPDGGPQVPTWDDVLKVAAEIRKLGHKCALVYTGKWYWQEQKSPSMSGHGFDLVNAKYGSNSVGTAQARYEIQGGDDGPGWDAYGGLTPVLWQFGSQITWGNKNLDMNAYRGDTNLLSSWFSVWKEAPLILYPYAYSGTMLTMEQLEARLTVKNAHPEFWRRVKPMLEAGEGKLGVGTLWRSSEVQLNTFMNRHYPVTSGGCCYFQGRRYQLKKGMAHAAPPGKSFHESTFHGYAAAGDMVGDLAWMHSVEKDYGLKDFRTVGSEPWHIQFAELPNSVTQWKVAGSPPPQIWKPEPEEEIVTDEDIQKIVAAVWSSPIRTPSGMKPASQVIEWIKTDCTEIRTDVDKIT